MKKKVAKMIKRQADLYAIALCESKRNKYVKGKYLIEVLGMKTGEDGEALQPNKRYKIGGETKVVEVNHYNKLKSFYNKFGIHNYIPEYEKWLKFNEGVMRKKYPKLYKKQIEHVNN